MKPTNRIGKSINKARIACAIIVSVFLWISLVGCSTVDSRVADTGRTNSSALSKSAEAAASVHAALQDRQLSRKRWNERKQRWYKIDKVSRERVYKDPKTGEWYIIDEATGENIQL